MTRHLVFVYGSLRSGSPHSMTKRFPHSRFVAEAKVSGSLYDLGEYPGLLLNDLNSQVIGEVYEIDDELLNELDDFEASSNYLRKQVEVSVGNDRRKCWTYQPDPDFYSLSKVITSGDWLEYARTNTGSPGSATGE